MQTLSINVSVNCLSNHIKLIWFPIDYLEECDRLLLWHLVCLGSMCVCYSQPLQDKLELLYTVVLVHKGVYSNIVDWNFLSVFLCFCFYLEHTAIWMLSISADCSKTFRVTPSSDRPPQKATQLHPLFIPIGHCTRRRTNTKQECVSSCEMVNGGVPAAGCHEPRQWGCVVSVRRLLHPGISAGPFPPLCQHQAAGDALSLPLSLR